MYGKGVWRRNFFICAHIQQWALHNETKTGAAHAFAVCLYIVLSEGLCWNGRWIANNVLISIFGLRVASKAALLLVSNFFCCSTWFFCAAYVCFIHGWNSSQTLYEGGILLQSPLCFCYQNLVYLAKCEITCPIHRLLTKPLIFHLEHRALLFSLKYADGLVW